MDYTMIHFAAQISRREFINVKRWWFKLLLLEF